MKKFYRWLLAATFLVPCISYGQGFTDNFNDNILDPAWKPGTGYFLYEDNSELRVQASKQVWEEFYYTFPTAINISANPRVTVRVKSNQDFFLTMAVIDESGNGENRGDAFNTLKAKVWGNREYMDVTFDFTGKLGTADFTKIKNIILMFNPAYGINATVKLDDFRVGSDAPIFPRMEYPMTQTVPMGNTARSVKLYGITNGTTVTATSSNTAIIPNPTISAVANGMATMTYTPNANQSGTVSISATVAGAGFTSLVLPFNIIVNQNLAPTITQVADQSAGAGKSNSINLTDIYDGNTEADQTITVTATSSDQSVIANNQISIDYGVNGSTHATLTFTPSALASGSKTTNITVTVMDNGGVSNGGVDTKTMTFKVTVYPTYYQSPSFDFVFDNMFAPINQVQTLILTNLKDGNGGTNIGSITAQVLSDASPSITTAPIVNYINGANTANVNYTASQKGTSRVVITVTNSGAPVNSNGNTSVTDTFLVRGIDVPLTGYIEEFTASGILGADYYQPNPTPSNGDWKTGLDIYPEKWYVEGQGIEQTLTLDPANKKGVLAVAKPTTIPRTFAGTWFSPRKLFDLSNNKYLSVKVSAVPPTKIAFDIFDVNGKRYGKLLPQNVGGTEKTLTFVFNDTPENADLDFTKITTVLINVSNLIDYNGTVTFRDLKIGDKADNAPAAPAPMVSMSPIGNRSLFTNSLTQKIDISDIVVIKEGIKQTTPVSLTVSSSNTSLIPTPTVSGVSNNSSVLTYSPVAGQTGTAIITVTGTAAGATPKVTTFNVDIKDKNTGSATSITYDPSTTFQTITGLGTMVSDIENTVDDLGSSWMRTGWSVGTNDLEYMNDNSDPNVLDLSKFKQDPGVVSDVKKAYAKGVKKFFATVWSPQYWMKSNLSYAVPFYSNGDNVLDPTMYDEFAEWIVGSTLSFKEETGVDLYAVSLQNEPEFDEFYGSAVYTAVQLKDVAILVGQRFKALGINTIVFYGEILPSQGHVLDWFQTVNNDPLAKDLVGAFATHNYDPDGIKVNGPGAAQWISYYQEAQRVDPKKQLWMTETSGHANSTFGAMEVSGNLYNALNYGNINGWNYFYANKKDYGMGFYAQKQFYKFIRPGAVRTAITSSDPKVLTLGFKHPTENTVSIVLINSDEVEKQVKLAGTELPSKMYVYQTSEGVNSVLIDSVSSGGSYLTLLPANSITTLYNVKVGAVTSTDEEASSFEEHIVAFPNPASHELNISLPTNEKYSQITLTDLLGRVVKVKMIAANHGRIETLDLNGLDMGMYILSVKGSKTHQSKILVK